MPKPPVNGATSIRFLEFTFRKYLKIDLFLHKILALQRTNSVSFQMANLNVFQPTFEDLKSGFSVQGKWKSEVFTTTIP